MLCVSGEWKLYLKQRVGNGPDFDVLGWWEKACDHTLVHHTRLSVQNCITKMIMFVLPSAAFFCACKGPDVVHPPYCNAVHATGLRLCS